MTMGGDSGQPAVAGGPARHIPVLVPKALEFLQVRDGGVYVDGTFGAGGYARAILAAANAQVIGIDRDPVAIMRGAELVRASAGRLILVEERFSNFVSIARNLGFEAVDGVVLDIGVSSLQLDEAERGFSFRLEGPLDMRMSRSGPTAADVVATASERDLAAIIFTLGEERHSRAIARAIVATRGEAPIRTTRALADIVARIARARPGDIHPATRTFQALRIFVNEELGELAAGLSGAEDILKPGARLVVVSFHSLEDRLVKNFLADRARRQRGSRHLPDAVLPPPTFRILTRRPVVADSTEIAQNPRARSAKLRAAERTAAAVRPEAASSLDLPALLDVVRGR